LAGTAGARFVFQAGEGAVVDSRSLNDFLGTRLGALLRPFAGRPARVGIMGVWTEAKVSYLAYELRTRYPGFELAVCSALTASSSRAQHFMALDQMDKLLGVRVLASMGEFMEFLGGRASGQPLAAAADHPSIEHEGRVRLSDADSRLLRHLFRDCRSVRCRCLDGGFSGNVVLGMESVDLHGHSQVPHVVKIGPQAPIGQERAAFERIESVLGNNAPRLADFADLEDRGALKYRYAAMGGGKSSTFQKLYTGGMPSDKVRAILRAVFVEQLGRFYGAASREKSNLLQYYCFKPGMAPRVRERVERVLGRRARGGSLRLPGAGLCPNPVSFYEDLGELLRLADRTAYFSYVHGDLNGANIIVDGHENVWLIDFFHTHRGHVLKDLIKLENDLLYIFTPVRSAGEFSEALRLTQLLMSVEDLAKPLPEARGFGLRSKPFLRALDTLRILRSFYPDLIRSDRDPLQLLIGQMRYAGHTLVFDESNRWQKLWALATAGWCGERIAGKLRRTGPVWVDWLQERYTSPGRLGITLLPGRKDHGRTLSGDMKALKAEGVTHVACLLTQPEFRHYGVEDLLEAYRRAGLSVRHLPIFDQRAPSRTEMAGLVGWMREGLGRGGRVLVHCAGGLGRSGLAAACFLKGTGVSTEDAIAEVRRCRGPRAVESALQEDFVRRFEP
jgi:protein-tyrosine phosphatase